MPKCINDASSSFKGTEPSPKGLGYCAHAEKVGSKMKGKNGKMWIIQLVAGKTKRWVPYKDSTNASTSAELKGCKLYFTHDNGGNPFMTCIQSGKVTVYKVDPKLEKNGKLPEEFYRAKDLKKFAYCYSKKVCSYKPLKIFIGNPPKTKGKKISSYFNGNTILLQINKLNYVFIGESIFEFKAYAEITQFVSPLDYMDDVSYPYALDKLGNYYLITDGNVIEIKDKTIKLNKDVDPYTIYFGHSKKVKIEFITKPIMNQKLIHKRLW
jgi:hypothetical protein